MIYDCFFSHQHDDLNLVESIVSELEKKGLSCWYAPRNVTGRYAKAIADAISHSKVFVLILNHRSAVSEEVLNEVELAHNIAKNSQYARLQPVYTEQLDLNAPEYNEMMYYIRRIQFVNAFNTGCSAEIADNIIKSQPQLIELTSQRSKSQYVVQDIEDERLKLQNDILKKFDHDIYERIIGNYAAPSFLDIGCGRGDMLISKIGDHKITLFLGIDKSGRQIEAARINHNKENYFFYEKDVESDEFESDLLMQTHLLGIQKFDIINISMLLLHLHDPVKLLTVLHGFLSDDGTIVIRDIDDGINHAFPDPTNAFDRIYKMCNNDEQSGNRRNGRQIHSNLVKSGFTQIRLERQGLSSVGMSDLQKEVLFNMYFPFTLQNAGIMAEKYPWNKEYAEDYAWYCENFDSIHEEFLKPDFAFSLGFMTYTARK